MDLLSGYSDSINYGNGYTPQANAGIANNNAAYAANQANVGNNAQALFNSVYGPMGFGGQTAYYAGLGAAYGRAANNINYGGNNDPFSAVGGGGGYPTGAVSRGPDLPNLSTGPNPFTGPDPFFNTSTPQGIADRDAYYATQKDYSYQGDPYGHMGYFGAPNEDMNAWATQATQGAPAASGANPYFTPGVGAYSQGGGGVPTVPDYSRLGYSPGTSAQQNGLGYPGGAASPLFNPSLYAPSQQGFNSYGQPGVGGGGYGDPYSTQPALTPGEIEWYKSMGGGAGDSSRDSIAMMLMGRGGDPSYLGAGGPNNDYNPFGQINSGVVGGPYNAFQGQQQPATFDQRFGNIPGQPYGRGYFDNTFGAVGGGAQPNYNPTAGGGYPGPMQSDGEAQRQQMIQDLYKTLGIIDNAGEGTGYSPYDARRSALDPTMQSYSA